MGHGQKHVSMGHGWWTHAPLTHVNRTHLQGHAPLTHVNGAQAETCVNRAWVVDPCLIDTCQQVTPVNLSRNTEVYCCHIHIHISGTAQSPFVPFQVLIAFILKSRQQDSQAFTSHHSWVRHLTLNLLFLQPKLLLLQSAKRNLAFRVGE